MLNYMFSKLFLAGAAPSIDSEAINYYLFSIILGFLVLIIVFLIIEYIFRSIAFMSIAKKVKYPSPGIAWIPYIGPALICSKTAKMSWWPILFLFGFFIPGIGFLFAIIFNVFFIIWLWKTYEVIGKPGWWAILIIIPIIGLIMLGIAAWSKDKSNEI